MNTIGAIAAALAKAQGELANPEKSLIATIGRRSRGRAIGHFAMRRSPAGLISSAKASASMSIATVQTTAIDKEAGLIRLTTTLAHESGEWVSSDWPVCPTSQTTAPHLMGAALTYARRYALFTLVGIAGEDDLDAPDLLVEPPPAINVPSAKIKMVIEAESPGGPFTSHLNQFSAGSFGRAARRIDRRNRSLEKH